jgi:flagellar biosynthesis component FlhA
LITNALQNQRDSSPSLGLSPAMIESIHKGLTERVEQSIASGLRPIVLCAATVRTYLYRLVHTAFPTVVVLSFTELPAETEIEFTGKLEISHEN